MRGYLHRGRGTALLAPPFYHIIRLILLLITLSIIIMVIMEGDNNYSDHDYDAHDCCQDNMILVIDPLGS